MNENEANKVNIMNALFYSDKNKLMELIPTLTDEEANNYLLEWINNYIETGKVIEKDEDPKDLVNRRYQILEELNNKANSSNYHK